MKNHRGVNKTIVVKITKYIITASTLLLLQHEYAPASDGHSESSQTSKMELFTILENMGNP